MMNKVALILTSLFGSGMLVSGQMAISEVEKLLGSDDFETRKKAMETLWQEGEISLETLEKLTQGDDPEIKARAQSLYRKMLLGLSPDTSQEILDLLDKYFVSSLNGKVALFNRLEGLKEYGLMLRLKMLEKDEEVLVKLDEIVMRVLPNVQLSLLRSGDLEEAKELLTLSDDFNSLIAYANICHFLGELDQEIGRLRVMDGAKNRARYLACLRVKGDPAVLKAEAERLGDQNAVMVASLAMGDVGPLFDYLDEEGDLSLIDGYYLDWLKAEKAGDKDRMERRSASIKHHVTNSSESYEARRNMLKMGLGDEILEGYSKDFLDGSRYDYLLGQDRNIEALKEMGLTEPVVSEEWLETVFQRTVKRFKNPDLVSVRPYYEFFNAAKFFETNGMVEEAGKCIKKFFDAARAAKHEQFENLYQQAFYEAPHASVLAFERECEEFEVEVGSLISMLYGDEASVEWLKVKLLDGADNRPPLEVLQLLLSFYDEPLVPVEFFEEVEKRFRDESLAEQDPEVGLKYLLSFARARTQGSDILLYCRLLKENDFSLNPAFEAEYLAYQEKYDEAAKLYKESDHLETPVSLYRAGVVLKRAGDPLAEKYLKRGFLLSQGASDNLGYFASYRHRVGEYEKSRELYRSAMLRMEKVDVTGDTLSRGVINGALAGALFARDWRLALALSELESWNLNRSRDVFYMRARYQVLFCRGMLAAEEGRMDDAVRDLKAAHGLIPRSGVLADDFFPALREAGLVDLHDELFEISAELIRENIRFFPKDHNMKNTFGWLASRANRCLEEAEGYLKEALAVRPASAAYLDTMGEIYFAMGDREKAVEWSNQSLDRYITDPELLRQNRRFRNGPFPPK